MALFDPNINHRVLTQWATNYTHGGNSITFLVSMHVPWGQEQCAMSAFTMNDSLFHGNISFKFIIILDLFLFYVYKCSALVHVCIPSGCLVPKEFQRGHRTPWNWS